VGGTGVIGGRTVGLTGSGLGIKTPDLVLLRRVLCGQLVIRGPQAGAA
jgi:hypothetical protein